MSRTKHIIKGKEFPAKTPKKYKDRKHFGFTSGIHSQFELMKKIFKDRFEAEPNNPIAKMQWENVKDKAYPVKNVDFVKYGYGNGRNKNKK